MKKFFAILLAAIMMLSMAAMAQTVTPNPADADNASITIKNASKGETYTIYKLFDATVTGTENGPIAYQGTIPSELNDYFAQDVSGNISAKDAAWDGAEMSEGLNAALKTWAATATKTIDAVSDGSELVFAGLPYGYYVITTTQGETAITVDSTNPNATIHDKNSTEARELTKTVDDADVFFGQTVTYTVEFLTSNYYGAGSEATQIEKYTVTDTLPEFLSEVTVTSVKIDNDPKSDTDEVVVLDATAHQFGEDKTFDITWSNETGSLYQNGAKVTIVYTAKVTDVAAIAGVGNTNEVTLTWGEEGEKLTDKETIFTYAVALKKVNDKGVALKDATFQLPFYVKADPAADGAYIYAGTEEKEGLVNSLTTPENGEITIKGLASGTYSFTETAAPNGYNKLTGPVTVTTDTTAASGDYTATTTDKNFYIDKDGNVSDTTSEGAIEVNYKNEKLQSGVIVVVNKIGQELPSTGGIGTTIFYVVGGLMMAAALVLLVSKRKVAASK